VRARAKRPEKPDPIRQYAGSIPLPPVCDPGNGCVTPVSARAWCWKSKAPATTPGRGSIFPQAGGSKWLVVAYAKLETL
jgi:hypothetical protein